MSAKEKIRKERFINYELYALLSSIDRDINNVIACTDEDRQEVTAVKVTYFDGREDVVVNIFGDSLAAIVKDVIDKLFFGGAR